MAGTDLKSRTKNSRLLAELRELDSYVTGSEDESSDEESRPSLAPKGFDNSMLSAGRSLLDAAKRHPLPGTGGVPSVTLRLTRLDPSPSNPRDYDPRIAQTIQHLRDMGIEVELGERKQVHAPQTAPPPPRRLEPTIRVNLDLSLLIALVSDITHSPLPMSLVDAEARYVPSFQYCEWKRKRPEACKRNNEEGEGSTPWDSNGPSEHSRALANQALQEMARGLLDELRDRLVAVSSPTLEGVEFWTTPEARDRCLRIVLSKIGGRNEKRRVAALFPSANTSISQAEDAYWENSRYLRAFLPVVPIRIFDSLVPPPDLNPPLLSENGHALSPFFALLSRTCRNILAQESPSQPLTLPPPSELQPEHSKPAHTDRGDRPGTADDDEIERATVMKANPRLTVHTVQSMLWGAARGWTTVTANKSSVKAILRDIRASEGGYGWFEETRVRVEGQAQEDVVVEAAAMWVVDPRSLAEGMRADYQEEA